MANIYHLGGEEYDAKPARATRTNAPEYAYG
jgi:hypothetical protein